MRAKKSDHRPDDQQHHEAPHHDIAADRRSFVIVEQFRAHRDTAPLALGHVRTPRT